MKKLTFNQWVAVIVSLLAVGAIMFSSFRLSPEFRTPDFLSNAQNNLKQPNMENPDQEVRTKFSEKILSKGVEPTETLKIEDLVEGTGAEATTNSTVVVNYEGFLASDGTKFDSSWDRGSPFEFTLGQNSVIAGWEQGVVGMKEGGIRTLIIPPAMAYGERQYGPIPGNSTLVFIVELLQVK